MVIKTPSTFDWIGGTGDFGDPAQWTSSTGTPPPGQFDNADFLTFGDVTGTGEAANILVNSDVTFDGSSITALTSLDVGDGAFGILTADNNAQIFTGSVDLGILSADLGELVIADSSTWTDNGPFTVGDGGVGSVLVSGSLLQIYGDADIGQGSTAIGNMVVAGNADAFIDEAPDSSGGNLTVGDAGTGTLYVQSGTLGIQNNLNIGVNGQGTVVQTGGTVSADFVDMTLAVNSGQGSSSYALQGGTLSVNTDLNVGGQGPAIFNDNGGNLLVGGSLNVNAHGIFNYALQGGALSVANVNINSQGVFDLNGQTLDPGASFDVASGGELKGYGLVQSAVEDDGDILAKGGTLDLAGNVTGTGEIQIGLGSTLELGGSFAGTVQFTNTDVETLKINDLADFHGTIDLSQSSGVVDFTNADVTGVSVKNGVMTVETPTNTYTFDTTGVPDGSYTPTGDGGTGTQVTICFYPGTRISTPEGERPVETLQAGDLVLTSDGRAMPVRWLGRQSVSTRFGDPLRILPIRVKAGALGDGLPARDLLLSPDHALLVGGVLVQAGALVNGISIVRETKVPESFTYYHVELDDHSLILAESVPAETFIDNVDRLAFDNWAEHQALYPEGKAIVEMPYPRAKSCRQVPRSIREQLAARLSSCSDGTIQTAA